MRAGQAKFATSRAPELVNHRSGQTVSERGQQEAEDGERRKHGKC
jgi:hypothetical protein